MTAIERPGLALLHLMAPERAHALALRGLAMGLVGRPEVVTSPRLRTTLFGAEIPNPVGTAAGFDKDAAVIGPCFRAGFGFVEVGTVTPRPQEGNPKPRVFRLEQDRGLINRLGFNGAGAKAMIPRLQLAEGKGLIGVNIGANATSDDPVADYCAAIRKLYLGAGYFTVNVSSPNTPGLRDLQGRAQLDALLTRVLEARDAVQLRRPLALKVSPDLSESELADVAELALRHGIDGIVATNTSTWRPSLRGHHRHEAGGLSGAPLFERSTEVLRRLRRLTEGRIPLIGVGGIGSAEDAYEKIRAGASAVQLYTALIYEGVSLAGRIVEGLDRLLARDGFASVAEAVGTEETVAA